MSRSVAEIQKDPTLHEKEGNTECNMILKGMTVVFKVVPGIPVLLISDMHQLTS